MPKPFNFYSRPRESRGSARERGYTTRWDKARKTYLMSHPLCVMCAKVGRTTPATVVDHIIPHRGSQELFWDSENNWAALCAPHHNSTKQREEKRGYSSDVGDDGWPIDARHPANK